MSRSITSYRWDSHRNPWDDHQSAYDQVIPIDIESFARVRPPRGGTGGTTGGTTPAPYTSGDPLVPDANEFNITLVFQGTWTTALKNAFIVAADALSHFILGDIPAASTPLGIVDDMMITAKLGYIDGAGGILGQAGPTAVRVGSYLPANGVMEFDSTDAAAYQSAGLFDDIVLHEMLHTVGFGTIWSYLGLATSSGFAGAQANAAYPGTAMVPIEFDGGPGTAWAHWDETAFGNELMTGWIDGNNDLSYVTIASLGDIGYSVVSAASYAPPSFI